jgi:hypothetical protein
MLIECTTGTPGLRGKLEKFSSRRILYPEIHHPLTVPTTPLRDYLIERKLRPPMAHY